MKKLLTLIALGSAALVSADSSYQQQGNQSSDSAQPSNYDSSQSINKSQSASDQDIGRKVQDALTSDWFSKDFKNVTFDVNNGMVTLKGSVGTLENKENIERAVRKIAGVKQVNNQITIAKESADSYSNAQLQSSEKKYPKDFASNSEDRQLNAAIRDKLSNTWFSKDYNTLVIRTTNGIVVVGGTVNKAEDIKEITDQIKGIEGVREVNNQLTVKSK